MMWEKIKKILQKEGGKCIVIEDNEPSYLVQKLDDDGGVLASRPIAEIEKVNRDIDEWKAQEEVTKSEVEPAEEKEEEESASRELKIEDLPF